MSFYKLPPSELADMQRVLLLTMGNQEALSILKKVKDIYPEKFSQVLQQLEDKSLQGQAVTDCYHTHGKSLQLFLGFLEE